MKSKSYENLQKILGGLVRFIFRVHGHNVENEPGDGEGQYIIVSNHISNVDPILICSILKKQQPHYMAKKSLFKIPLLRGIIKAMGAFPVNRGGADVNAIKHAIKLLEDGKCVGIFPQGHRYPGEDPRNTRTKNGMALIATKAQANIVPAYIWRKNNRFRLFRRTYIILGDMIPFESLGYDPEASGEYARITNVVFDKICDIGEEFERERKEKKNKKRKA